PVALFPSRLLADVAQTRAHKKGLYARIGEKAAAEHAIPGTTRTRVAAETIRDWLKRYRRGGFDALVPRRRADRGRARSIPEPIAEFLCSLKEQKPALSVRLLIGEAPPTGKVPPELPLPPSTVNRPLTRARFIDEYPDRRRH